MSQNSRRLTFDPLFFKEKRLNTDKTNDFASFLPFVATRVGKCLWILIFGPDLDSSHEGEYFIPQNERG